METSTFERGGEHIRGGAWLYRDGEIQEPPGRDDESAASEENQTEVAAVTDTSE